MVVMPHRWLLRDWDHIINIGEFGIKFLVPNFLKDRFLPIVKKLEVGILIPTSTHLAAGDFMLLAYPYYLSRFTTDTCRFTDAQASPSLLASAWKCNLTWCTIEVAPVA